MTVVNLYQYADIIGVDINMVRVNNQKRWVAHLENVYIREGAGTTSIAGFGERMEGALLNLCKELTGKTLTVKRYNPTGPNFEIQYPPQEFTLG